MIVSVTISPTKTKVKPHVLLPKLRPRTLSWHTSTTQLRSQCRHGSLSEFYCGCSSSVHLMEVASKPPAGFCFPETTRLRFSASSDAAFDRQDEELRQDLLKKLISRQLTGPTLEVTDSDPSRLPVRELPPGSVSSLYLVYVGWTSTAPAGSSTAACKSTFYGAWKRWSNCLRFRRRSEHAMCVVCQKLKAQIHAAKDRILVVDFYGTIHSSASIPPGRLEEQSALQHTNK